VLDDVLGRLIISHSRLACTATPLGSPESSPTSIATAPGDRWNDIAAADGRVPVVAAVP